HCAPCHSRPPHFPSPPSFPTRRSSDLVTHTHATHLVIKNVEDLIGWQVRLNYDGDRMRPLNQNTEPFVDNATFHSVGFANLPIRSEEHTSELQSRVDLVCRLLLEKKNT